MFIEKYFVEKKIIRTKYGSVCIENVEFNPEDLQQKLPQIIFDEENLKYMFSDDMLDNFSKFNIFKRFIPKDVPNELTLEYVTNNIKNNKNFYSFLAEGILGLVYKDLYNYKLSKGLIDMLDTVNDTHTGVDACMYDRQNNVVILGEAKFYEDLNQGINKIISDFTNKNIKNKIESLETAVANNREAYEIAIKNIDKEKYEKYSLEEFLNQKLVFAGFVLHSETSTRGYDAVDFYDRYNITSERLKKNIEKSLNIDKIKADYNIVIIHLPIKDKKTLIMRIIEIANKELENLRGGIYE